MAPPPSKTDTEAGSPLHNGDNLDDLTLPNVVARGLASAPPSAPTSMRPPSSARTSSPMPSTSRGGAPVGDADAIGAMPQTGTRTYTAGGLRPISQPGVDPTAARPPIERPRSISQPGHDPAQALSRPISQPAHDPAQAVARPISRPSFDPYAAVRRPPTSQPAHDPGGARPISQPGRDPHASPVSPVSHRPASIGGVRSGIGTPTYRSESSASRPTSQSGADPFAVQRPATPVSQSGRDPFAAQRPAAQAAHPGVASQAPRHATPTPVRDPLTGRPTGMPVSQPSLAPFQPRAAMVPPNAGPVSRPAMDPFAPRTPAAPISKPAADPFGARPPGTPISRPAADPFGAVRPGAAVAGEADPEFAALIRSMPFATPLTEGELRALSGLMRRKSYAAGEVVVRQGQPAEQGAIVSSGLGHMQYATPGRDPVEFGEIRPGDIIGEGAVAAGGYHGCSVVADTAVVVWSFEAGAMTDLQRKQVDLGPKLKALLLAQQSRK